MPDPTTATRPARQPTVLESCFSGVLRMLPVKHGAHRILDHLRPNPWVQGPQIVDMPYRGHVLQMDVSDLVGWHFLMLRNFDPEVTEVLERFSSGGEDDVFWDIGANKGACSYEIATKLPHARIVAIEPQQSLVPLLERNLRTLAPGRHEVSPVAIGESPGMVEIFIPESNWGAATMVPGRRTDGGRVELIRVLTAEVVQERSRFGWPTLIKIDVEGFEPAVIRSLAPAFAARHVRCCVFECHATEAAAFAEIRAATEPHGYGVYAIHKSPFTTTLLDAPALVPGATDYAIVRKAEPDPEGEADADPAIR